MDCPLFGGRRGQCVGGAAMTYELYLGDCLQEMNRIADHSIDAIICDPPYGTTACAWDSVIPFESMWEQLKRVIKPRGAIVLFGSQPFTSALIMSNAEWFKYSLIWKKTVAANFFNAKNKPLCLHEDISIFSNGTTANGSDILMTYNPQGLKRTNHLWKRPKKYPTEHNFVRESHKLERVIEFSGYPGSILEYANGNNNSVHPTQKPVDLLAYLIRTYTNEGETVLDFTMGSGSTGVAAMQTGRKFIGIELKEDYFNIAVRRITDARRAAEGLPKQIVGNVADYADSPLFEAVSE